VVFADAARDQLRKLRPVVDNDDFTHGGISGFVVEAVVRGLLGDHDVVRVAFRNPAAVMRTKRAFLRRSATVGDPVYPIPARRPPTS
jgi:hypothetical protein